MQECIFCKIVQGKVPCFKIYESELFLAFLDINPIIEGHTILISKRHFEKIYDLKEREQEWLGMDLFQVIKLLERRFGPNVVISSTSGKYASQTVPHFHFHLIPRQKNDRLWDKDKSRIILDRSSGFSRLETTPKELKTLAKAIAKGNPL